MGVECLSSLAKVLSALPYRNVIHHGGVGRCGRACQSIRVLEASSCGWSQPAGHHRLHRPVGARSFSSSTDYGASSSSADAPADGELYSAPGSAAVFSDLRRMDKLSPRQLRVLLSDAVTARVHDPMFWAKASACCLSLAPQLKFFDSLLVLECFAAANLDDRTLVLELAHHLVPQVHRMEPRHLIQAIDVFGRFGKFPEQLFMEVFCALMRDADKLYGAEYASLFLCLSRWQVRNPQLLSALCHALCKNVSLLRYPELCQVASCARSLDVADPAFYLVLDEWQRKELRLLPFQEIFDAAKKLRTQEVKCDAYEEALLKEFVKQSRELVGTTGIDQLADPFDCLNFLRLIDALSGEFVFALTRWCADAVHNPPARSQKRPESHDLVNLHNLVEEYQVDSSYLDEAILKFVTSKGGLRLRTPRPIATQYKANRKYVYAPDPQDPGSRRGPLHLGDDDLDTVSADEALASVADQAENEHISAILDEMDPLPSGIAVKKAKKPSTQSCGRASFRLKAKTSRHKNVAVTQAL